MSGSLAEIGAAVVVTAEGGGTRGTGIVAKSACAGVVVVVVVVAVVVAVVVVVAVAAAAGIGSRGGGAEGRAAATTGPATAGAEGAATGMLATLAAVLGVALGANTLVLPLPTCPASVSRRVGSMCTLLYCSPSSEYTVSCIGIVGGKFIDLLIITISFVKSTYLIATARSNISQLYQLLQ